MPRFAFVLAFVAFVVVCAVAQTMPPIPCTFSAHYREKLTYRASKEQPRFQALRKRVSNIYRGENINGYGDYDVELDWYSIENKYATQVQDNITLTQKMPDIWTCISPFFERKVGVRFQSSGIAPIHCPEFPTDAKYQGSDTCPNDKRFKCDWFQWWSSDLSMYQSAYFIPAHKNALDMVIIETEDYLLEEYFYNMTLDTPPMSRFEPAKDQPFTDLTTDPKVTAEWKSSLAVGNKARLYHNNLPLLPSNLWRSRNDPPRDVFEPFRQPLPGKTAYPDEYDTRKIYPLCTTMSDIRDQGKCGSCWAFGAAETFGDRYCTRTNKSITFSPQYLVDCYKMNDGCEGGSLDDTWNALKKQGICSDECYPYTAKTNQCSDVCADGSRQKIFKARSAYSPYVPFQAAKNVQVIQREIITNGPVEAAFFVLDDFYNYAGGVYSRSKGAEYRGAHAIKILGWGVDASTKVPYWIVANSWGKDWGEKGFFRIRRGNDECGIESQVAAGLIDV